MKFIHQSGIEKSAVDFGTAFNQEAINPTFPQQGEEGGKINPMILSRRKDNLGTKRLNGCHLFGGGSIGANDPSRGGRFLG
jgi:hypothetical protein